MMNEIISYPDDHVKEMYLFYLDMFKRRYVIAADCQCGFTKPCITWAHISFWRKELNRWGGIMVSRNLLDPEEYFLAKREYKVIRANGDFINIEEVRESIELHPDDLKNK